MLGLSVYSPMSARISLGEMRQGVQRERLPGGTYPLVVVNVAWCSFDTSELFSLTKFMRAMMGASCVHREAPVEVAVNVPSIEAFTPDTEINLLVTDYHWDTSYQRSMLSHVHVAHAPPKRWGRKSRTT